MILGKLIGVLLGFVLSKQSLLGAVLGLIIGHWIDRKLAAWLNRRGANGGPAGQARIGRREEIFTIAVVNLAAKLAKIDGVVVRAEIDAFKTAFKVPPGQGGAIGKMFDRARANTGDYEGHARTLADNFSDSPVLLAEVLTALHRIALADGTLHPSEQAFLEKVAAIFGLAETRFGNEAPRAAGAESDPYAVLGVGRAAPMSEIKAVWRKLTREHHPDAMMARGVPKEYVDLATERMAAINAAYDRIRAERGEA